MENAASATENDEKEQKTPGVVLLFWLIYNGMNYLRSFLGVDMGLLAEDMGHFCALFTPNGCQICGEIEDDWGCCGVPSYQARPPFYAKQS